MKTRSWFVRSWFFVLFPRKSEFFPRNKFYRVGPWAIAGILQTPLLCVGRVHSNLYEN